MPDHAPQTPTITDARRRVLSLLKRTGSATAGELGEGLEMTDVAARQHLAALEEHGLVEQHQRGAPETRPGRGRPSIHWRLTDLAQSLFPDHHAELTVGLISAIRKSEGEEGLQRIIDTRARDQAKAYRKFMPGPAASLRKRVDALADQRTHEGYMAEVIKSKPGEYLLIEHHCPICDAAKACTGLCAAELSVFQKALGKDINIERTKHLLSEGDRCVYRIWKK